MNDAQTKFDNLCTKMLDESNNVNNLPNQPPNQPGENPTHELIYYSKSYKILNDQPFWIHDHYGDISLLKSIKSNNSKYDELKLAQKNILETHFVIDIANIIFDYAEEPKYVLSIMSNGAPLINKLKLFGDEIPNKIFIPFVSLHYSKIITVIEGSATEYELCFDNAILIVDNVNILFDGKYSIKNTGWHISDGEIRT